MTATAWDVAGFDRIYSDGMEGSILNSFWRQPEYLAASGPAHAAPEDLAVLARSKVALLREAVAANRRCDAPTLALLAADPDANVRGVVAAHPNTYEHIRAVLARDPRPNVRAGVARRTTTPELLTELSTDPDNDVRYAVACSAHTTTTVRFALSADRSLHVRAAVASSNHTPSEVLAHICSTEPGSYAAIYAQHTDLRRRGLPTPDWRTLYLREQT